MRFISHKSVMFFLCLLVICLLFCFLEFYKQESKKTLVQSEINKNSGLLSVGWQKLNTASAGDDIKAWLPLSIKIIFFNTNIDKKNEYLVSLKRVGWTLKGKKNMLWEFPGGQVDAKENPLTSLKRELREEDKSKTLLAYFKQYLKKEQVFYKNIKLKNNEHHCVLKIMLENSDWSETKKVFNNSILANKETYGFYFVDPKSIKDKKLRKALWTPKSRKILKQLDLS